MNSSKDTADPFRRLSCWLLVAAAAAPMLLAAQTPAARLAAPAASPAALSRLDALKKEAIADVESRTVFTQQMVDQIFSFGELGFQEFETSKYVTGILEKEGFNVEHGISGIPTAWMASWGSGKPVIALGTDIDGIPQGSQKPGVAYHDPLVTGGPGHGEGHNSGMAVIVTAALAAKKIMEREKLPGTIRLWPGVAEELLGAKAYFVRDGYFKDVDVVVFNHVGSTLSAYWGEEMANGLVSVEYTFTGESAHSAGSPWRGRSALDAVELMNAGWNYRREHLRLAQRSHYVITDGGDQPNVVPRTASVWYYFREADYPHIKDLWEAGNDMARGAALMTKTEVTWRILGSAWPRHDNKPIAEMTYANIERVGLPEWSADDVTLAKATQRELNVPEVGLPTALRPLRGRASIPDEERTGGGSDDIGDIMWSLPTIRMTYPSNFEAGPGHNWANAIAMATPIAHKGATAGAKVNALNILDLVMRPELVTQAWDYFNTVQTKDRKYQSFLSPDDKPAIWLNKDTMEKHRPQMQRYYYDPSKYSTYLEQLGIKYPTIRAAEPTAASRE
jgi:aminobenzoyl-glutamate utilization protein B